MMKLTCILAGAALVFACGGVLEVAAQALPDNSTAGVSTGIPTTTQLQQPKSLTGFFSSRTPYEFWLTVLNVCFGLTTLGIVLAVFRRHIATHAEQLIRFSIVVVIVIGTLVLITAGYSNEQVAPAFGLFGTIVGYILGRMSSHTPAGHDAQGAAAAQASAEKRTS